MQLNKLAVVTMAGAAMFGTGLSSAVAEQASKDHSISFPTEKLAAIKGSNETLVEGTNGKYSVSLRRLQKAEGSSDTDPKTINLWYVVDGSGSVTTSGKAGSVTDNLKAGDVEFIPAGLAHRLNTNGITLLNVRWDNDWKGPMGAGNPPVPGAYASGFADQFATPDKAIHIPKEMLDAYVAEQDSKKSTSQTERMIEGGHFNINIRNITEPSIEFHKNTIDVWVVLEGSGTANTGYSTSAGDAHTQPPRTATRVAGTGAEIPMKVGDAVFVPSNLTHGFSAVNKRMAWLNIRFDDNYGAK